MFWKFDLHTTSHIDSLLEREDVTLLELLDEEDVLQECKVNNRKLVDFLSQPQHMETLVTCITQEPPTDLDERLRYKYPNISCEILTADVTQINDALGEDESLLNRLYGFLQIDDVLNPLLSSFFSKVLGILINRKTEQIVAFLRKKDNFVDLLLKHIGTSAIMDLLLRLLTCVEQPQLRQDVFNWLNEEKIVQRLIDMIHQSKDDDQHSNASQSLCDIIRLSREQMIQIQDSLEPDQLLATLEKQETIEQLLSNMFDRERNESVIVNGILVLLTLLEPRRLRTELAGIGGFFSTLDGHLEMNSNMPEPTGSQASLGTLLAIKQRLGDFHQLLLHPPKKDSIPMTWGTLDPPLGNTRLHVVKLFVSILNVNNANINQEVMVQGSLDTMLDLYFHYVFNNFLHTQMELCVSTIVNSLPPEETVESNTDVPQGNLLIKHLLEKCQLVERILSAWEENDKEQAEGGRRKGYMGHLTRIANSLVQSSEKGFNHAQISQTIKDLSEEQQERWKNFVSGPLSDTNKKNTVDLVNSRHHPSSSDDDESDLKEFSFPQEAVLQQAYVDYQMQQMSSAFVDHFGFNDEEFGEQEENVNTPFDKTANINFSLNADDESPNSNLFDICYKERIQQFDDDEGSDGDDMWQEKEIHFSTGTVHSSSQRSSGSTDSEGSRDSEEGEDEEVEKSTVENSDDGGKEGPGWIANFDSVPMETPSAAPVPAPDLGSNVWGSTGDRDVPPLSEGWAMFTDFTLQPSSQVESQALIAMETSSISQEETPSIVAAQGSSTETSETSVSSQGQQADAVPPAGSKKISSSPPSAGSTERSPPTSPASSRKADASSSSAGCTEKNPLTPPAGKKEMHTIVPSGCMEKSPSVPPAGQKEAQVLAPSAGCTEKSPLTPPAGKKEVHALASSPGCTEENPLAPHAGEKEERTLAPSAGCTEKSPSTPPESTKKVGPPATCASDKETSLLSPSTSCAVKGSLASPRGSEGTGAPAASKEGSPLLPSAGEKSKGADKEVALNSNVQKSLSSGTENKPHTSTCDRVEGTPSTSDPAVQSSETPTGGPAATPTQGQHQQHR
ncbi:serine/threonine-protein phosphatase 6 regulatory subunit 1 isoform X3 [Latimeria chalumnae]|uniref:serine/threonine-protein phosphatase 6 regulatory subunit 1 isoform X3 n=1 Tax=Latimeria chalumnae TaxID=7897 RepID=UPI00313DC3F2